MTLKSLAQHFETVCKKKHFSELEKYDSDTQSCIKTCKYPLSSKPTRQ